MFLPVFGLMKSSNTSNNALRIRDLESCSTKSATVYPSDFVGCHKSVKSTLVDIEAKRVLMQRKMFEEMEVVKGIMNAKMV